MCLHILRETLGFIIYELLQKISPQQEDKKQLKSKQHTPVFDIMTGIEQ